MRTICRILLGVALLQGAAYAADGPEIEVVDGKISMSVQAMPLSRVLSLLDKAMGTTSTVKPEFANRNISAQFRDLDYNLAVRKIFEGQPLNYVVIAGKGIKVIDAAQGGTSTGTGTTSSFSDNSVSPFNSSGIQPVQNNPIQNNPIQPLNSAPPIQQANPQQNPNNPQQVSTPFGPMPNPNAAAAPANQAGPLSAPGQLPPAVGGNNPLISPVGGGNTGNPNPVGPFGGGGGAPPAPTQPAAPGTIGGATPGTIGK